MPNSMRQTINLIEDILYRGDASEVEQFSFAKTDDRALFGQGIYLTDNREIAKDYTFKGSEHVLFQSDTAKSPRGFIQQYLAQIAPKPTEDEMQAIRDKWEPLVWKKERAEEARAGYYADIDALKARAVKQARQHYDAQKKSTKIVKDTTGTFYLISKDKPEHISVFDIPREYLSRCLHGDEPLSADELAMVKDFIYAHVNAKPGAVLDMRDANGDWKTFDDWVDLFRSRGVLYAWESGLQGGAGKNPSLDAIRNGTHAGCSIFHYHGADFIKLAQSRGYVGIVYDGGTRVGGYTRGGGGLLHKAYVFWDEDAINRFRITG